MRSSASAMPPGKNYATYAYDEDVVVARFDGDDLTKSTIGRIKDDGNDKVTYVLDGKVLMGVCITEVKGTDAPVAYTVKWTMPPMWTTPSPMRTTTARPMRAWS